MVMNEVFEKLRTLQDILARKNELEAEIAEAPKFLKSKKELLERLKADFIEENGEHEEMRTKINSLKNELSETETKKEKSEQAMDDIKTQREYEALDKEIHEAEKKCVELRKDLQKLESSYRILEAKIKEDEALIKQSEKDIEDSEAGLEKELSGKKSEVDSLKAEEKKVSPDLSEETMFKFKRIIKSKHGLGIVPVRGGVCTGCHMILPSQFANEVRESKDIKYCPYCSRILFYEESAVNADEGTVFEDSDMGGLADLV